MEIPHVVEPDKRLERSEMVERLKRLERTGPHNERSATIERLERISELNSAPIRDVGRSTLPIFRAQTRPYADRAFRLTGKGPKKVETKQSYAGDDPGDGRASLSKVKI